MKNEIKNGKVPTRRELYAEIEQLRAEKNKLHEMYNTAVGEQFDIINAKIKTEQKNEKLKTNSGMTQEQIERLREWHKELINKKINKATKHNRFWAELRAVNKVFGLNLTAHILDITKIYLNDELISEVKL